MSRSQQIDPRHRYGHNLHCYYDCWLRCESKEPFFYWSVMAITSPDHSILSFLK
jgi:hypothetical protein